MSKFLMDISGGDLVCNACNAAMVIYADEEENCVMYMCVLCETLKGSPMEGCNATIRKANGQGTTLTPTKLVELLKGDV